MQHIRVRLCRSIYRPRPMALLTILAGVLLLALLSLGLALYQAREAQREELESHGERFLLP